MKSGTHLSTRESQCCSSRRGAIAIVGSAGGIPALIEVLSVLPEDFPLPIFIAQHLAQKPSVLVDILSRHTRMPVAWATDAQVPMNGTVYVAPPAAFLQVHVQGMLLSPLGAHSASWLQCGDRLLESVSGLYGAHTVGIVLSGMMPAGVNGIRVIKKGGGLAVAQSHASSSNFEMPAAAIDFGKADIVLSPSRIGAILPLIAHQWLTETAIQ